MPLGWGCGPYYKYLAFFLPFKSVSTLDYFDLKFNVFLFQTLAPEAFKI